ncbi:zinc ribbon domain-containing protein [Thioclava sp. 15-R06ZXC-3]|uniref:Zinc ribbon domain-containing protein n=1 Tax=Thioclava arctica TaxID=3238301 RepID=A0ABV3TMP9_9RHOB
MSGLLICGCCGKSFVKRSDTSFGCAERIKGCCDNKVYIRQDEIETRVFKALQEALVLDAFSEVFDTALQDALGQLRKNPPDQELPALVAALDGIELSIKNLVRSLENGAPYANLKPRMEEMGSQKLALKNKIIAIAKTATAPPAASKASTALSYVLERILPLLKEPDWVHLANEHLANLVRRPPSHQIQKTQST